MRFSFNSGTSKDRIGVDTFHTCVVTGLLQAVGKE